MSIPSSIDYVIIGSGFGGAISATRIAEAGYSVVVLELGENWDKNKLQQTQDLKYLYRLYRDYPHDYMEQQYRSGDVVTPVVTAGMGVGGGSIIYSNIHLRTPAGKFTGWPSGWSREELDPYYDMVEDNLSVQTYDVLPPRAEVFAQGCAAVGRSCEPIPVAIAGCRECGWCNTGCKFDKKQSLFLTYIPRAEAAGAQVFPNIKAMNIRKETGGYKVNYISTADVDYNYHVVTSGSGGSITCTTVIIAGGSIESPVLLERSLPYLNSFDHTHLGRDLTGNGDFATGTMAPQSTWTYKGKPMAAISMDENEDFVLEDVHGIPLGPTCKVYASFPSIDYKQWNLEYKRVMKPYGEHMLAIGMMGNAGGSYHVTDEGGMAVLSKGASYEPVPGAVEAAESIITALGGEIVSTPWSAKGQVLTAHPLGGCAMGRVVDSYDCSVPNNPNLYVLDGSVIPVDTMVNPANTIGAVVERVLERIVP